MNELRVHLKNQTLVQCGTYLLNSIDYTLHNKSTPILKIILFRRYSDFDWLKGKGHTSIHQTGSTSLATSTATPLATLTSK